MHRVGGIGIEIICQYLCVYIQVNMINVFNIFLDVNNNNYVNYGKSQILNL